MSLKLKKLSGWPPGGFPFADPKTGRKFDGMSGDLDLQTRNVIVHRRANPRFYPANETHWFEAANVRQEIVDYMCGLRPEICVDGSAQPPPTVATFAAQQSSMPCLKCGSPDSAPIFCKSCSGQKVVGWKCNKCGAERSK